MTQIELIVEQQLKNVYATGPGSVVETARRVALAVCAEQRKLCADSVLVTKAHATKGDIHTAVASAGVTAFTTGSTTGSTTEEEI